MVRALRSWEARLLPHGVLDVLRQIALFGAAYYAYRLVRGLVDGKASVAFEHGRDLISFERSLHAFIEPSVQNWASAHEAIIDFASWMYINTHFVVTLGTLVFIYLFRNESFYFIRNMFMVAMGLALVGYMVFPAAPPRYFPEWGFRDSVAEFTGIGPDNVTVNALYNPFAAVPSMHIAFALMIGWPMTRLVKPWFAKVLWAIYPFVVLFVVVSTGNHFWTDGALGAVVAAVSAVTAKHFFARVRPHVWAFAPTGSEATA